MEGASDDDVQLLPAHRGRTSTRPSGISWATMNALLPDSLRDSPYTWPTLVAALLVLAVFPLRLYFALILIGAGMGYFAGAGGSPGGAFAEALDGHPMILRYFDAAPDQATDNVPKADARHSALPAVWRRFVSDLVRDIVDMWLPNVSREGGRAEFHAAARSAALDMAAGILRMIRSRTKDTLTLLAYGTANALIVHVSEYRAWQASGMSLDEFVLRGNSRRREWHFWTAGDAERIESMRLGTQTLISTAEMAYLRRVAETLLRRVLPRTEAQSTLVPPLLREVIAVQALLGAAERLSDPDWINTQLISLLQDPADAAPTLAPGWHMVSLRILRGRGLGLGDNKAVSFVLHVAGRRVRTHRVQAETQLGDEAYRFRLSERVLRAAASDFRVHLQMIAIDADGSTEHTVGYARLALVFPPPCTDGASATRREHTWLQVIPQDNTASPRAPAIDTRALDVSEILVEAILSTGPSSDASKSSTDILATALENTATDARRAILRDVLRSHERLMALLEAMAAANAPPFVQFLLNVDALRGFGAAPWDDTVPLSQGDLGLLQRLRREAADVFATHFGPTGKYRVSLEDYSLIERMRTDIARSDSVDASGLYVGGPVGAAIFADACTAVETLLIERYAPLLTLEHTTVVDNAASDTAITPSDHGSLGALSAADFVAQDQALAAEDVSSTQSTTSGDDRAARRRSVADPTDDQSVAEKRRLATEVLTLRHKAAALRHAGNLTEARAAETEAEALDAAVRGTDVFTRGLPRLEDATVHVSTVPEAGTERVYEIRVTGAHSEYVVQRTAADVAQLHSRLSRRFHKVACISAPKDAPSYIEAFLNMLVSDAIVRQAEDLRLFVDPGHGWAAVTDASAIKDTGSPQSFLRSMISSTTSLLLSGVGASESTPSVYMLSPSDRPASDPSLSPPVRSGPLPRGTPYRATQSLTDLPSTAAQVAAQNRPAGVSEDSTLMESQQDSADDNAQAESTAMPAFVADFTEAEVEMLVEIGFALAAEVFDLHEPSQWLRRRLLGVFKQLLKQAYGDTLAKTLTDAVRVAASKKASDTCAQVLRHALYPEVPTAGSNEPRRMFFATKNKMYPDEPRSEDERYATMVTARTLVVRWATGPDAPIAFESMVGRYGAVLGATRVFSALQCRSLNKTLLYILLDLVLNLLLADNTP